MLMAPKLVLFDIDGTLIDPGRVGRISATRAFHELFSIEDAFFGIDMAGKTDIQIIKEALSAHGMTSWDGIIPDILKAYIRILKEEVNSSRMVVKPGVVDLLDYLKDGNGFNLGLLTGNIEPGGRTKLGVFDLNRYFPFGAFGNDSEDRNSLLPVAVEKFKCMTNIEISFDSCIVIGDTPRDVACARPFGAISIAVATGSYSYDDLLKTGADYVLMDLTGARQLKLFSSKS
jgi:phosphoglycolate phosphatase